MYQYLRSNELSKVKVILFDVIVFKSCKLYECMKLRRGASKKKILEQSKSSQQVKYALVQRFNLEDLLNNVCCCNVCFYNRSAQQRVLLQRVLLQRMFSVKNKQLRRGKLLKA